MIMVKAGDPVDDTIRQLVPHLEKGDIIIDGGNSHFPDSNRRQRELEAKVKNPLSTFANIFYRVSFLLEVVSPEEKKVHLRVHL
jgi:hypothetical protein